MSDDTLNPTHYKGDVQPIDLIEAQGLGFNLGNVVKYICRAGRKGDLLEDLKKARWYLEREILNQAKGPIKKDDERYKKTHTVLLDSRTYNEVRGEVKDSETWSEALRRLKNELVCLRGKLRRKGVKV